MRVLVLAVISGWLWCAPVFANNGNPIDGGTTEIEPAHRELLKAVVELKVSLIYTCTATVVDTQILLTAWHCVKNVRDGDSIIINRQEGFKVLKIEKTSGQFQVDSSGTLQNTDLALILVQPKSTELSTLLHVSPATIVNKEVAPFIQRRVFLAGYGETSVLAGGPSKVIVAGYNRLLSEEKRAEIEKRLKELEEVAPGIAILGDRTMTLRLADERGAELNVNQYQSSVSFQPDTAVPGPADSGGPLFGFDAEGRPWIIGVSSKDHKNLYVKNYRFSLTDSLGMDTFYELDEVKGPDEKDYKNEKKYVAAIDHFFAESWGSLAQWAEENGILSKEGVVLHSFQMVGKYETTQLGIYADLAQEMNVKWLNEKLGSLRRRRDFQK